MATQKDGTKDDTKRGDLARDDEGARAFSHLILGAEDGQLHADLTKDCHGLLKQLRDHARIRGKAKGELVITVKFDCDDASVISLSTTYKTKAPTPPRRKTTMWLTEGGNLSATNPRQLELGVRGVPAPRTQDHEDTRAKTRGD